MSAETLLVQSLIDACWNNRDEHSARRLASTEIAGRMLAFADRIRRAGPDVSVTIDVLTTNDDGWVGTLETRVFTHTGPATGPLLEQLTDRTSLEGTGRVDRVQSANFYRVHNGEVVELIHIADNLNYFSRFGRLRLDIDTSA